ncbi:MAG: hypothetical protein JNK60_11040, partial [Acidobacteria bacterium]|nr:hypothetical protein [Acidobacteriota bacterium]
MSGRKARKPDRPVESPSPAGSGRIKGTTIALFLLVLVAPGLQSLTGAFAIPVLDENRSRASRPVFTWHGVLSGDAPFGKQYEKYFDDHYGFRDFLIRAKHQIDFTVFHRSDEVLIGRDGYLFYRSVTEQQQLAQDLAWEGSKARLWKNLHDLHDHFAARGILFVVLPLPNKNTLYPELLPSWTIKRPKVTAFHHLRAMLAKGDLPWVDAYQTLVDVKRDGQLFHRTDFHWNDVAAAFVGRALVDELGRRTDTGVRWDVPVDRAPLVRFSGGEALSLGLFTPPREDTWVSPPRMSGRSRCEDRRDPFIYVCKLRREVQGTLLTLLPPT